MDLVLFMLMGFVTVTGLVKENYVFELVGEDFEEFLQEFRSELRVVWMHSPILARTGKEGKFEFLGLVKEMQGKDVLFAKVDLDKDENLEVKKRFVGKKGQSLVYCLGRSDRCVEYGMGLKISDVKSFLLNRIYKREKIEKIEELDQRFENSAWVLGVFKTFDGTEYQKFVDFSYRFVGDYHFGFVRDYGEWAKKFGLTGDSILVVHGKNLRTDVYPYYYSSSNFGSEAEIQNFLQSTVHPFVTWLNFEAFKNFNTDQIPLGVLFINQKKYSSKVPFFVQKFAESSKDKLVSLHEPKKYQLALADTQDFLSELQILNLHSVDLVFVLFFQGKTYKLDSDCFYIGENFISDCFTDFFKAYELQKLPVYLKSEPLPSFTYDKGIKVSVGSTFKSMIESKDTLHSVFVYSPQAKDYKKTLSFVESMANHYKKEFNKDHKIDFIKINADKNSVPPEFQIQDKCKLFISSKKKIHEYKGQWDYMKLHGFFNTHLEARKSDL